MLRPGVLAVWLAPFAVFAGVLLLYTVGFLWFPASCAATSVMLFFLGGIMTGTTSARLRGRIWPPLGVALLTATATASGLGLYLYDQYAVFPMFYRNARTYRDVLPSLPSAAVADGGALHFSSGTSVDTDKAVGYMTEAGAIYCIAPLRDAGNSLTRVEFWAVGIGCCRAHGTFECDEVADPAARAGIRVWDNDGWFGDANLDNYAKARRKAEATFGMLSAGSALYVRWVREENLSMLSKEYRDKAIVGLVFFILVYFFASAALADALCAPGPRAPGPPP